MPKLRKKEIVEVKLPSFEDGSAVVKIELPATIRDFEDVDQTQPQVLQTASIIAKKVKEWNLEGDDDKPLPITADNIAELEAVDFGFLSMTLGLNKLTTLTPIKKNS